MGRPLLAAFTDVVLLSKSEHRGHSPPPLALFAGNPSTASRLQDRHRYQYTLRTATVPRESAQLGAL